MKEYGQYAIVCGDVVEGSNKGIIADNVEIIEFAWS